MEWAYRKECRLDPWKHIPDHMVLVDLELNFPSKGKALSFFPFRINNMYSRKNSFCLCTVSICTKSYPYDLPVRRKKGLSIIRPPPREALLCRTTPRIPEHRRRRLLSFAFAFTPKDPLPRRLVPRLSLPERLLPTGHRRHLAIGRVRARPLEDAHDGLEGGWRGRRRRARHDRRHGRRRFGIPGRGKVGQCRTRSELGARIVP